ncbi:MAG: hypothetical protein LBB74_06245 [Chitinispirillales bacterium]|nr:hypothetical protein [Chitinispirillales bacterium]
MAGFKPASEPYILLAETSYDAPDETPPPIIEELPDDQPSSDTPEAQPVISETPKRSHKTGFTLGFYPKSERCLFSLGVVHSRPMFKELMSFNIEGNLWGVYAETVESPKFDVGFNLPLTALFQLSIFSIEAGVHGDLLFDRDATLFNAGFVTGAGIGISKKHPLRFFYRYSSGYKFYTHIIGMWWLF